MARFENLFIGIAGMIGAGKSTLATALGSHLDIDVFYEPVEDNTYLEDFYRDTAKYSFAMQVYLLNRRFQQHQEIIWRSHSAAAPQHYGQAARDRSSHLFPLLQALPPRGEAYRVEGRQGKS